MPRAGGATPNRIGRIGEVAVCFQTVSLHLLREIAHPVRTGLAPLVGEKYSEGEPPRQFLEKRRIRQMIADRADDSQEYGGELTAPHSLPHGRVEVSHETGFR